MAVVDAVLNPDEVRAENSARVVWTLAWPAVALNSMQVINTLLDRGFVGHLSQAALSGHGASTIVAFLVFSFGMALATGATAIVSRAYGEGNPEEFRRGAQEAFSLSVILGIVAAIGAALGASFMASLVLPPTSVEAQHEMTKFVTAYAAGLPALFVMLATSGSMRGIGDTKSPMYISGIQILLHMTLNFFLIFPPRHLGPLTIPGANLGLLGAGCALSISAWVSAIIYFLYVPRTPLGKISLFYLIDRHWAWRITRIAFPAAVMGVLRVMSLMAFTMVLKQVNGAEAAIGGMSIAFAMESIMFMPAFGLSAAAGALVGQSLGMKDPDRAERLAWTAGHHAALVTIILCSPIFAAAPIISSLMTGGKPESAMHAATLLRFLCATEFLFSYAMVMLGAMQGAGDTKRPLWITLGCLWGLRVPLALILSLPAGFLLGGSLPLPIGFGLGTLGAWIAMSATQGLQGILALFAFKSGAWKTAKV